MSVTLPGIGLPIPTQEEQRASTFRSDAARIDMLDKLRNATPAQIDTWVENQVTNLASAKVVLAMLIKILATVVKE
jgi:hypothetical protein